VKVLAGPPWWNAGHLAALAIGILFLALIANAFVHHIENWRLHAIFEERERLAHEMHDTVAQSFAGIGFQLEAIRSGLPAHLPQTHQQLNLASDLVRHSHQEARRSIAGLRPDPQRGADPLAALEQFALRMVSGGAVQVIAERKGGAVPIHLRVADTLFRIGQEATANAIRHAHPGTLTLSLQYLPGMVELTVADDGVGFDRLTDSGGFGIRGMRQRAESISATFRIQSAFGEGTIVRIAAPLPPRVSITSWTRYFSRYSKRSQV
jgi:signal transduction histidine kinase